MKNRTKTVLLIVAVALLSGLIGYNIGNKASTRKIEEIYNKEKQLSIRLSQSSIEGLGEINGTIYVVGHKKPDTDSVVSAITYANLLKQLGYDAQPMIAGPLNLETEYVLESGGIETPSILENAAGLNVVLTDHSEQLQTVDGMIDANIIAIIDHHGIGGVSTGKPIIYDARPIGAASTIVWMDYRDLGIEIDQKTAHLLVSAILSDTSGLQSSTATFADREALDELAPIAGIDDPYAYYQEMYKAYISYKGMSDEEIYFSDYKEYEAHGKNFSIACVSAYDEQSAKDLAERMKNLFAASAVSQDMDYSYVQISIFHDGISIGYLVSANEESKQLLEEAFEGNTDYKHEFDGTSYRFEPGYSRKQVLVPALTEALRSRSGA